MRQIKASEFKAKCLALIDEVAESGETLVVTKHGKPVVRVQPDRPAAKGPIFGCLKHLVEFVDPNLDTDEKGKEDLKWWYDRLDRLEKSLSAPVNPSKTRARARSR
jgi:prevent-host-death family protein